MIDFNQISQRFSSQDEFKELTFEKILEYNRIVIPKDKFLDVCKILKEEFEFDLLIDIVGVDRFTKIDRFEVIYILWSVSNKTRIFLRVKLDSKTPEVDSVTSIWPTGNWQEREVYDMFGIIFRNHPDLRRIYMMDSFEYYPLRKDYPLMGIPGAIELPKK